MEALDKMKLWVKPVRTKLTGCGDTLFLVTQVLAGILFLARLASLAARRTLKLASLAESSAAWQAVIFLFDMN